MKNTKGISLIVLVITIIVMIVLAGAIVLTISNSGIMDKATNAVTQTNYNTVKELANMAWAEAYADGARTQNDLEEAVYEVLESNKIDKDKYGVYVTTSGVTIGWIQEGLTVRKGNTVLEIGDDFEYDENVEGKADAIWKVLGASENGELLILSDELDVCSFEAELTPINRAAKLNRVCEPYGKGRSATGARSIKLEDIDKSTGFNKTTYQKGKIDEYGNEITLTWKDREDSEYLYIAVKGKNGSEHWDFDHSDSFTYYDGTNVITSEPESDKKIGTFKLDYYEYEPTIPGPTDKSGKVFNMLFGSLSETGEATGGKEYWYMYWLATPYTRLTQDPMAITAGIYRTELNYICPVDAYTPFSDDMCGGEFPARAVVSLEPYIEVSGSSETGWTY